MTDRRYVSIVSGDMEKYSKSWLTDRKLYVSSSPVDDGKPSLQLLITLIIDYI